MIDGPVTADKVIALTDLTFPRLKAVASFDASSGDDLAKLRKFGKH